MKKGGRREEEGKDAEEAGCENRFIIPKLMGFLWSSKVKQWIEIANIAITIVLTGQEGR